MIDDTVEFRPWIEAAMNYSYRVAWGHGVQSEAEDVAQETIMKLGKTSQTFTEPPPGDTGRLYWFFLTNERTTKHKWAARRVMVGVVSKRTAINAWRAADRRRGLHDEYSKGEPPVDVVNPTSPLVAACDDEDVKQCVQKLPEPCKTCFLRDSRSGPVRTEEEAAREDGMTPGQIKNQRRRYRELLRECLKSRFGDGGAA
jgi:DNA-directed RNA polymerase specialized sigma24 family protein